MSSRKSDVIRSLMMFPDRYLQIRAIHYRLDFLGSHVMKIIATIFSLVMLFQAPPDSSGFADAGSPGELSSKRYAQRIGLCARPSSTGIEYAARNYKPSDAGSRTVSLMVDYDARGVPKEIVIHRSSGFEKLDAAIVAWAKKVKVCTVVEGKGELLFTVL